MFDALDNNKMFVDNAEVPMSWWTDNWVVAGFMFCFGNLKFWEAAGEKLASKNLKKLGNPASSL